MADKKDPSLSPRHTNGPVVKTGPTAGQNRARNNDGAWRKKRDDAGKTRDKGKKTGCFITTAACTFQGLPDDCYELTALRAFRDNYLLKNAFGRALVEHYYQVAPALAAQLTDSTSLSQVWSEIQHTVAALEQHDYAAAVQIYRNMVKDLQIKFENASLTRQA